jgi:hypothetical protein
MLTPAALPLQVQHDRIILQEEIRNHQIAVRLRGDQFLFRAVEDVDGNCAPARVAGEDDGRERARIVVDCNAVIPERREDAAVRLAQTVAGCARFLAPSLP